MVPVTPPEIVAHAVEIAARVANSLVDPDAVAQFVCPSYCMHALMRTCDMLKEDQMMTANTTTTKTMPWIITGFFISSGALSCPVGEKIAHMAELVVSLTSQLRGSFALKFRQAFS